MYVFLCDALETEFESVRLLKQGPRGTVRLVRHRTTGKQYIVRQYAGNGEVYRRLLTVRCPYLPQVAEAAEQDGRVLVLEEYIQGDTLDRLLRGSLFTLAEARQIARQLCQALWVLHSFGAVHRDVKPENVILRGDRAILIDFDASRLYKQGLTADTQVLGTTGYAAPEQYGLSQSDARTDIYSMGVLLNVMLTGKHPSRELAPGHMGRIVRRCTMMNPQNRYDTILHLMQAL